MASRPPLVILSALGERQNCCSPGSLQMSSKPLAVGRPMPFYATGTLSSSWPPSMWKISPLLVLSPQLHSPFVAVAPSAGLGRVLLSPPLSHTAAAPALRFGSEFAAPALCTPWSVSTGSWAQFSRPGPVLRCAQPTSWKACLTDGFITQSLSTFSFHTVYLHGPIYYRLAPPVPSPPL